MQETNGTEIVEESAWCHVKKKKQISLSLSLALFLSSVPHPFSPKLSICSDKRSVKEKSRIWTPVPDFCSSHAVGTSSSKCLFLPASPLSSPSPSLAARYSALLQWMVLTVRSQLVSVGEIWASHCHFPTLVSFLALVLLPPTYLSSEGLDKCEGKVIG